MPTATFKRDDEDITIEFSLGDRLFDAFQDRGHELHHGCLAGSCGSCRINILKGADCLKPPGTIEKNTIAALQEEYPDAQNIRLSCRATVENEGHIEFEELR